MFLSPKFPIVSIGKLHDEKIQDGHHICTRQYICFVWIGITALAQCNRAIDCPTQYCDPRYLKDKCTIPMKKGSDDVKDGNASANNHANGNHVEYIRHIASKGF